MSLTDKEYQDLKKDDWIGTCIVMLKDIMEDNPVKRSKKIAERKEKDRDSTINAVNLLEDLINNQLLSSHLGLEDDLLSKKLQELKNYREEYLKIVPKRIGKNTDRNFWIESTIVRLYDLGYTVQRRRLEFIYKLFYEYNFDGCRTAMESEHTSDKDLDRFDQENMMDLFKHIDRKAINDYLGEK